MALPDAVARHGVRALRLRVGDELTLFDGAGGQYRARLVRDRERATVEIVGFDAIERESPLAITLVQGIAAADRMDWIVQKSVELGVAAIVPVVAARTVSRFDQDKALRRRAHWRQIAVSACEQCGRNQIPEVALPRSFPEWIAMPRQQVLQVVLSTLARQSLTDAWRTACATSDAGRPTAAAEHPPRAATAASALVLAGPEGGFSDAELRMAERSGLVAVSLGPRVLRTETAALAALTVLQSLAGALG